jgi:hypothetical protein
MLRKRGYPIAETLRAVTVSPPTPTLPPLRRFSAGHGYDQASACETAIATLNAMATVLKKEHA